jgi:hypothetical protein
MLFMGGDKLYVHVFTFRELLKFVGRVSRAILGE